MAQIVVTKVLSSVYKGDFAIATAMLSRINAIRPDWSLTVLCRDVTRDRASLESYGTVGPELFAETDERLSVLGVGLRMLRYLLWHLCRGPWLDSAGKRFLQTVEGADAVVFCGGGSLGGYGLHNLVLFAFAPLLLVGRSKVPVIFAGIGLEPSSNIVIRLLNRWTLNRAALVLARDNEAAETIRALGVTSNLHITADWAFTLPASDRTDIESLFVTLGLGDAPRIGINLRDSRSPGPDGVPRDGSGLRLILVAVIDRVIERTGAEVIVVSMNRSKSTDDLAYAESVRDSLSPQHRGHVHILPGDQSPNLIKGVIGAMDIFIGTRLHPTIFAVSQGVPSLAIHHLSKVRGFMNACGLQNQFFTPDAADPDTIVEVAITLLNDRARVSAQIRARLPALEAAVARNVLLMEACLEAPKPPSRQ